MDSGQNLKKLRKKAKLTQTELATKINVSLRTIQRLEKNEKDLTVKETLELSTALGVAPIQLIQNEEDFLTSMYTGRERDGSLDGYYKTLIRTTPEELESYDLDATIKAIDEYLILFNRAGLSRITEYISDLKLIDKYRKDYKEEEPIMPF